jgi:hypothetical protein
MSWGSPYAAMGQQLMSFGLGQLQQKEDRAYQSKRDEMAAAAAKDQEKARQDFQKELLRLRQQMDDEQVAQTFTDPETGQIIPVTQGQIRSGLARVPQSELNRQRAEAERAGVEADRKARLDEAEINRRQQVGQGAAARGQAAMIRAQQARQGGEQQTRPRTEQNFVDEFNNHLRAVRQLTTGDNNVPKELREQATRLQQQLAEFAADKNATPAEKAEAARILTAQLGILPQQIR